MAAPAAGKFGVGSLKNSFNTKLFDHEVSNLASVKLRWLAIQEGILKLTVFFSGIILFFMFCICSCSNNKKVRDGFFRGMYEGSNQFQEMKHADELPQPREEPPTYDQYQRERQEIIIDRKSDEPQPQVTID